MKTDNWKLEKTQYGNRFSLFKPLDETKVAVIEGYYNNNKENEELAAFIVLAVNNHDKLIEALKGFIENAVSDKRIADNQISYYKGQFNKLIQSIEQQ